MGEGISNISVINSEDFKKNSNKVNFPSLSVSEQQLGNVSISLIIVCDLLRASASSLTD